MGWRETTVNKLVGKWSGGWSSPYVRYWRDSVCLDGDFNKRELKIIIKFLKREKRAK